MVLKQDKWFNNYGDGLRPSMVLINLLVQIKPKRYMKQLIIALSAALVLSSCQLFGYKHIEGNGIIATQTRNAQTANKLKMAGSFDVEITEGPTVSVQIEGDENILPYIIVEDRDGFLVIKTKEHINYSATNDIKVFVTTPKLEQVILAGSGNIIGKSKFSGSDKLDLKIAGSGDMKLEVNTPNVHSEIAGSGSIALKGETKDESVKIAGVGDYNADELKAETAKISIAGSGDVKVFAAANLDVNIAGAGTVYYKGSPTLKQRIAGSGEIKKID